MTLSRVRDPCSRRQFLTAAALGSTAAWFKEPLRADAAKNEEPITPRDATIPLFNGKDLAGLYGWLKDTQYADPRGVFTVKDGALVISGEVPGYLATKQAYRDYHLVMEYKWGPRTYGQKTVRNSGILLHAIGPDGNP